MRRSTIIVASALAMLLGGCTIPVSSDLASAPIRPLYTYPVTSNDTPYSRCLKGMAVHPGTNLPTIAVGEIADKTGQYQIADTNTNSTVISQGITEMVVSAFYKTRKVRLVERFDLRIPLAELKMVQQGLTVATPAPKLRVSDFTVMGALTELNYNIVSDGARLVVSGIGGGGRTVVINVALDVRVVDSRSFDVVYVSSLQKQIYGYEIQANVFRFFGHQLVEFDAGRIQNEPLQIGVRSVVEMAAYQIMTDFLGLPSDQSCPIGDLGFTETIPLTPAQKETSDDPT